MSNFDPPTNSDKLSGKFLRLDGDHATMDLDEYDLQRDVARILGILASAIG
jgi:hypothetical protein